MNGLLKPATACAVVVVLTVSTVATGTTHEARSAQPQQQTLAKDVLSDDEDQRQRAVLVAEALGAQRMSEDVRIALMALMEQMIDKADSARAQAMPTEDVVQGEFFLSVARILATLEDPRAIAALARVGDHAFSVQVAQGLASFGEQALPDILKSIDRVRVSDTFVSTNLLAVSMMVQGGSASDLSPLARADIVRVARESFGSKRGTAVINAIDIAVALNEPELIEMVTSISQDPSTIAARGVSQFMVSQVHKHAVDALAKIGLLAP